MTKLAFLDTETTGLYQHAGHEVWEVGLITRDGDLRLEFVWQLPVDLAKADPMSLSIGRFHERRWDPWNQTEYMSGVKLERSLCGRAWDDNEERFVVPQGKMSEWAESFAALTRGAHLVGAVPSFDERFLGPLLRKHGQAQMWHYHIVDIEALAAGWLASAKDSFSAFEDVDPTPPWNSETLSRSIGVDPDQFDRHTALGDARWAEALYDKVMGDA